MRRDDIPTDEGDGGATGPREGSEEQEHDVPEDQAAMEPEVGSTG
ncbi:MAG TPA: hypothetical protein VHK89_05795 [Actinomycetota bacterium]|jgi:hypothetical protein|nr:hypothetical protein [Actinomycetota bacterium]